FQAEDGIRVFHVTGVQTCALPISLGEDEHPVSHPEGELDPLLDHEDAHPTLAGFGDQLRRDPAVLGIETLRRFVEEEHLRVAYRSEERRVGKGVAWEGCGMAKERS